jgi:quinohemoprotein ethanol dehydrogenase
VIARGQILFEANCSICHINMPRTGSADLTRLNQETHLAFDDIVFNGLLKEQGMPQWNDVLKIDDIHAIHAYIIKMSQDAYRAQQARFATARQALRGGG